MTGAPQVGLLRTLRQQLGLAVRLELAPDRDHRAPLVHHQLDHIAEAVPY